MFPVLVLERPALVFIQNLTIVFTDLMWALTNREHLSIIPMLYETDMDITISGACAQPKSSSLGLHLWDNRYKSVKENDSYLPWCSYRGLVVSCKEGGWLVCMPSDSTRLLLAFSFKITVNDKSRMHHIHISITPHVFSKFPNCWTSTFFFSLLHSIISCVTICVWIICFNCNPHPLPHHLLHFVLTHYQYLKVHTSNGRH